MITNCSSNKLEKRVLTCFENNTFKDISKQLDISMFIVKKIAAHNGIKDNLSQPINYGSEFRKLLKLIRQDIDVITVYRDVEYHGRFNYKKMKIFIKKSDDYKQMYFTLIHEFGHYISYNNLLKFNEDVIEYGKNYTKRELDAYFQGWRFIKNNNLQIRKIEWRQFHYEIFDRYCFNGNMKINPFKNKK